MTEPRKITREEADQIIMDWQKSNNPMKKVTMVWNHQWYDVRKLTEEECLEFASKLTGVRLTPQMVKNIQI